VSSVFFKSREFKESRLIDDTKPEMKGRYPVVLVDRVNHAQVAAGHFKSRKLFPQKGHNAILINGHM
jgi:hypothetical protein